MAEKSEKATPKKLRDARKKGQVAKSQDFPSAFTFIASLGAILMTSHYIYDLLSSYLIMMLGAVKDNPDMAEAAPRYIHDGIFVLLKASLPILVFVVCVGVTINFLIVGPVFSSQVLKPDIKRLNPVTNIKNIFKMKTLFELTKSILKITIAIFLIVSVIWGSVATIASTVTLPVTGMALVFNDFLVQVILRVGIFFILVAVFDLMYQKKNFAKEMKMEKYEVKQEYKETEGDPHIKGKRRQLQQEIAYQEGPSATKRSRVVLTNPEHFAAAIEYVAGEDPAPKIATMGRGREAEEIMKIALDNNIPIFRNPELTRALYFQCSIGQYIPEEYYKTIAQILKWVTKLEQEKQLSHIFEGL